MPGYAETRQALEAVEEKTPPEAKKSSNDIKQELTLEGEDELLALARTRMRIEFVLRRLLGKRIGARVDAERDIKFLTLAQLLKEFFEAYPDYTTLEGSFSYVRQITNAATHAQRVPSEQVADTIDLGARLIAILVDIARKEGIEI